MMKSLLSINSINTTTDSQFVAQVVVDENHEILKAHFPNFPIVPGACLIDCAKDIVEAYFKSAYRLISVKNVKFLQIVDPQKITSLQYLCAHQEVDGELRVNYTISSKDELVSKISLVFIKA